MNNVKLLFSLFQERLILTNNHKEFSRKKNYICMEQMLILIYPNMMKHTGHIVDVIQNRIYDGEIEVADGKIISVNEANVRVDDVYILPGLIDSHVHIESSMLVPSEFARLAVVHGTVGTVSDPHEIANVLGIDGVNFMLENAHNVPFHFCFGAPSCVPATPFETAGAILGVEEVEFLLKNEKIGYLAEMMNFPGVLIKDPEVMAKLAIAKKYNKPVDGHAPGLKGKDAETYINAGISTDHECYTIEEGLDKIHAGMHVLIREGSAARNFDTLIPLLNMHPGKVMFCSDDKHPDELVKGHINKLLIRAVEKGCNPMDAIKACTYNPVKHYKLKSGLLQTGDSADFIKVNDLVHFNVLETWIKGEKVAENGKTLIRKSVTQPVNKFEASKIEIPDIDFLAPSSQIDVIQAFDGELLTDWLKFDARIENGKVQSDEENDVLKLVVLNRYQNSKPAVAFIKGFGFKKGAVASSVAHDSHNIIAIGTNDSDLVAAINQVIENKGGISVFNGNESLSLPLPVAGLMSVEDGYLVAEKYEQMNEMAKALGSNLNAPFMTLSFMALLVIPKLKLSDKGLFDGTKFAFV